MAISPTRAFALGACSILVVAGVFVAGIGIGARNNANSMIDAAAPFAPAERIECPASPGFTATKAANERIANCEDAQRVQSMLLAAGVTRADVTVERRETGQLLGPESSIVVLAQVDLTSDLAAVWDAEAAARAIARQLGTSTEYVTITDERLRALFDGSAPTAVEVVPAPPSSPAGAAVDVRPRAAAGPTATRVR